LRKIYTLFIVVSLNAKLPAQSLRKPIAASYIGLGAYSINHVDAFSATSNQAALAQIKTPAIGVYGENRFLLNATNMYSAVAVLPTLQGNFGLQIDYFGFKDYNESQVGLAYARSLGSKLDVGVKFNYYSFRIPAYQNSSSLNFEIGAIAHLTDKLNAGIHFYNPAGANLSKTNGEKLSSIYSFGIGYEASENFLVSAEIVKQEDVPVNVNAGVQYNFQKQFFVRVGINSENESPYAGAGISWKDMRLDVSAGYHPQLGLSPGLMLIVNLKSKEVEKN
jgi:long-subunit fatty acid transport protein